MTTILAKKNLICQASCKNNKILLDHALPNNKDPRSRRFDLDKFLKEIPDGSKFVYRICVYTEECGVRVPEYEERGIAQLDGMFVNRLELIDNKKNGRITHAKMASFPNGTLLSVESVPSNTNIPIDNAVFTSDSVVQLNSQDCLIICDDKGNIGAADLSVITKYLQSLKSLQVDVAQVDTLFLNKTTRPRRPKDGMLIYNRRTGDLEFYNGTKWNKI